MLVYRIVNTPGSYQSQAPAPIPCLSHNDYWRRHSLFDALHWGCTGVEADLWLFGGELYVGHTKAELDQDRTFQSLYVDPLIQHLDKAGTNVLAGEEAMLPGVYNTAPKQTLVLLVDFKTGGQDTYDVVHEQLRTLRIRNHLSYWDGENFHQGAVTVVVTGSAPWDVVANSSSSYHDIFYDAPLAALWEEPRAPIETHDSIHAKDGELDYGHAMSLEADILTSLTTPRAASDSPLTTAESFNISNSYYASTSFASAVGFVWRGHLSPRQMRIIRGQIKGAKRRGLKARYWDTPLWPTSLRNHVWHVLVKEGADILNVDDLEAAARQSWNVPSHDFNARLW